MGSKSRKCCSCSWIEQSKWSVRAGYSWTCAWLNNRGRTDFLLVEAVTMRAYDLAAHVIEGLKARHNNNILQIYIIQMGRIIKYSDASEVCFIGLLLPFMATFSWWAPWACLAFYFWGWRRWLCCLHCVVLVELGMMGVAGRFALPLFVDYVSESLSIICMDWGWLFWKRMLFKSILLLDLCMCILLLFMSVF